MRYGILVLAMLALNGCVYFQNEAQRGFAVTGAFGFPAAFTSADVRVITERRNPVTGQQVVCSEPSPDVAKALSAAFAASAQGGNGTITGNGAVNASTSEAAAELAGRSTALLGLRDGLFQACQAYANGAIGADTYALIISRYGQLMTTLFLAQDIAGTASATAKALSQAPQGASPAPAAPAAPSNSVVVNTAAPAPAAPSVTSQPSGSASPPPGTNGPAAIARMNEDYMNLDYNFLNLLATVCINQYDPTNMGTPDPYWPRDPRLPRARQVNGWLQPVCRQMVHAFTPAGLKSVTALSEGLVKNHVLAPPIDPMGTSVPAASSKPAQKPAAKPAQKPAPAAKRGQKPAAGAEATPKSGGADAQ
jgi:hypothetical protein